MRKKTIFSNRQRLLPPPKITKLHLLLEEAAKLAGLKTGTNRQIALNFLSARQIKFMNRKFLAHDYTTDVISFAYQNESSGNDANSTELAAEIFVCPQKALEYALEHSDVRAYPKELTLYIVHGILHAAGELDGTPSERRRMRARENAVMKKLSKTFDFNEIFPLPCPQRQGNPMKKHDS